MENKAKAGSLGEAGTMQEREAEREAETGGEKYPKAFPFLLLSELSMPHWPNRSSLIWELGKHYLLKSIFLEIQNRRQKG